MSSPFHKDLPPEFTYPPELLPSPDEDDETEVIVVDPKTGEQRVIIPAKHRKHRNQKEHQ